MTERWSTHGQWGRHLSSSRGASAHTVLDSLCRTGRQDNGWLSSSARVCNTRGTGQPSSQEVGPGRTVSLLQSITVESKSRISMVLPVAVTAAAMMENPAAALLGRRVDTDDRTRLRLVPLDPECAPQRGLGMPT